jgi:glycosyltransferase involved in cell wall biosynthesis
MNISFADLRPLSADLPKIVVLSDIIWGPIARICRGLLAAGADLGIICLNKSVRYYAESDERLMSIATELTDNGKSLFQKYLALVKFKLHKYPKRQAWAENALFDVNLGGNLAAHTSFAEAELALVGFAPGLFNHAAMQNSFKNKAVVYWLPIEMAYTGYCAYSAGCDKWKNAGCANCPQLGSSTDGSDLAAENFLAKQNGYSGLNMAVVTPSKWLGQNARDSLLLKSFPQINIPTDVNLDIYTPRPREVCRQYLGLPSARKILLFGAGTFRKNKGFHLLPEALEILRGRWEDKATLLAFFGKEPPPVYLPPEYESVNLGYLDDTEKLAAAYSAADVFVSPSFQDNLPNTVNEALSCGTSVICFNRFSSEDVVQDGINGYLAAHPGLPLAPDGSFPQDPIYSVTPDKLEDLASKIQQLVELPDDEYMAMRVRCRAKAMAYFSPVLQAARYLRLFRRMLGLPEISLSGFVEFSPEM